MNRHILIALIVFVLVVLGSMAFAAMRPNTQVNIEQNATTTPSGTTQTPTNTNTNPGTTTPAPSTMITVTSPTPNQKVTSPLTVTGQARGNWYFEASFPVELRNASGTMLAQVPAQAQGDWMTTNFVPFKATLTFPTQPAGSKGTLIFHKDNPSGLPENDAQIVVPVTF